MLRMSTQSRFEGVANYEEVERDGDVDESPSDDRDDPDSEP